MEKVICQYNYCRGYKYMETLLNLSRNIKGVLCTDKKNSPTLPSQKIIDRGEQMAGRHSSVKISIVAIMVIALLFATGTHTHTHT